MIRSPQHRRWIIVVLGFLSAMNPLSTDMYLPAFQGIAHALQTSTASLSLTLSSYFIGIGVGQLAYGPLLDRFGRKTPLYAGLGLYVLASIGCIFTHTLEGLVVWRFFTAVGGCVASVVSVAMVRDLFSVKESAKIFSLLMLVLGVSPLLAPTIGSAVAVNIGWQGVFVILMFIALIMIFLSALVLPESHSGDDHVKLTPGPILRDYWEIFIHPQFTIYALVGGSVMASLFAFIAASPVLFFNFFHLSIYSYGWIFTLLAAGFISGSQINLLLLRRFSSIQILRWAVIVQILMCLAFMAVAWSDCFHLPLVLALIFGMLLSIGCASPNAAVLAMAPFASKAGRASALLSSSQMLLGSVASIVIGLLTLQSMRPIAVIFALPALLAGLSLYLGKNRVVTLQEGETVASLH